MTTPLIPRPLCPILGGFCLGQVLVNLVVINPSVWINSAEGLVAIWALVSFRVHVIRRNKAVEELIARARVTGAVRAQDLLNIP